ncbi:MAG: bifunctional sulfate adenylyltransferase/adenylylsulfate kinase [Spirochaetes bacterium]|nr:bifunctional sulfate adenylyltransferase/adenylylsulfate kinase [Spirochaetota bacterium]
MPLHLIDPHGGTIVDLLATEERAAMLRDVSKDWISWELTPRQLCDLELLINGGFSPLDGFMGRDDYESVCGSMHLKDGTLWPIPIVLDLPEERASTIGEGASVALRDPEGLMVAALTVSEVWKPDRDAEAKAVYGTTSHEHPGVSYLLEKTHPIYVGGRIEATCYPEHHDFRSLRLTPRELRERFLKLGWRRVVAFQTRNPMHRAHYELTMRAAGEIEANLLIHPVVGMTKPGDIDHYTRVRCYQKLIPHYPTDTVMLSLLQLSMRIAGPREAILHAIIRKNHGCSHLIVGRDHAGPGKDSKGKPFYGPYDAQEMMKAHEKDLGIEMVPFRMMVYAEERGAYMPVDEVPEGTGVKSISGTELRERLQQGADIPEWFTFPEIAEELRMTHPPKRRQGFTVFFTGLSGAGKSTIAKGLLSRLLEIGGRPVTLLDGDIVRTNLSSELGFSKEDRDINIRRIGFVASEITKNGGIAICAPIAPYDRVRKEVREMISRRGGFVLVHVATPLEVCEQRDRKGLYAKARAGIIREFTGVSDPYEEPADAEIVVDTSDLTPEEEIQLVILHLEKEGFVGGE